MYPAADVPSGPAPGRAVGPRGAGGAGALRRYGGAQPSPSFVPIPHSQRPGSPPPLPRSLSFSLSLFLSRSLSHVSSVCVVGPRLAAVRDAVDVLAVQSAVLITVRQVGHSNYCSDWCGVCIAAVTSASSFSLIPLPPTPGRLPCTHQSCPPPPLLAHRLPPGRARIPRRPRKRPSWAAWARCFPIPPSRPKVDATPYILFAFFVLRHL